MTTNDDNDDDSIQSKLEIDALLRRSTQFSELSVSIPPYTNVTMLDLGNCSLSSLPTQMPQILPNVKVMFLSNNKFIEMPPIISQFRSLDIIAFKGNRMKSIHPNCFIPNTKLRWIILTNNCITTIPDTIGNCTKLQKFMLSGNCLPSIPSTIANCTELELIRLSCNQLVEPPLPLLQLPKLKWVAFGRNTFLDSVPMSTMRTVHAHSTATTTKLFRDIDETAGTVLGRGASGVTRAITLPANSICSSDDGIHTDTGTGMLKSTHNDDSTVATVAVKTYHDDMITSDGTPELERRIALLVSQIQKHDLQLAASSAASKTGFIHVYGQCDPTGSLVMEYLHMFQPIADPPSLDSCTRDVYNPPNNNNGDTVTWSLTDMVHFVNVLLYSLRLLHLNGITHGDFYGHNVLVSYENKHIDQTYPSVDVRLSDFGASFIYDSNAEYGKYVQIVEIRAFQVLLEEVSEHYHCDTVDDDGSNKKRLLSNLIDQCHTATTFDELYIYWQQQQLRDIANEFDIGMALT